MKTDRRCIDQKRTRRKLPWSSRIAQPKSEHRHPHSSADQVSQQLGPFARSVQDKELRDAGFNQTPGHGARRTAGSKDRSPAPPRHETALLLKRPKEPLPVGVGSEQAPVPGDDGIHGTDRGGLRREFIDQRGCLFLVGKGDVCPAEVLHPAKRVQRGRKSGGLDPPWDIEAVDTGGLERGVLHHRRETMLNRIAEDHEQPCLATDPHAGP